MEQRAVEALGRRYAPAWLRLRVLKRDDYHCVKCKVTVTNQTANIDHVRPWPWGMTEDSNLQTLCRPCNQAKGHKFPKVPKFVVDGYTGQMVGGKRPKYKPIKGILS